MDAWGTGGRDGSFLSRYCPGRLVGWLFSMSRQTNTMAELFFFLTLGYPANNTGQ